MALPTAFQTTLPILKALGDGEVIHIQDLYEKVLNTQLNLTPEESGLKMPKGVLYINDRISWGKTFLKKAGLVTYPERAHVQITQQGKELLNSGVTLEQLSRIVDEAYKSSEDIIKTEKKEVSPTEAILEAVDTLETNLSAELLELLQNTNPYYFEKIVLRLFEKMGYGEFTETPKSGDKGIDGILTEDSLGFERIYVQAKRYKTGNNVREPEMRNFIGAMSGDVRKGIFVTTAEFHPLAVEKALSNYNQKIILIDGRKLVNLMIKHNVGVQIKNAYEVKEIDNDFFEEDQ